MLAAYTMQDDGKFGSHIAINWITVYNLDIRSNSGTAYFSVPCGQNILISLSNIILCMFEWNLKSHKFYPVFWMTSFQGNNKK